MDDLLSPTTDAGVVGQVIGLLALTAVLLRLVRRERALVTLTIGITLVLLGLIGMRGMH